MKKIFSFLVLFLLTSYVATDVFAEDPPCPVVFSNDVDHHPYNIGFVRTGRFWTLDHEVSSTVIQQPALPEDADDNQRWEFVLVDGSTDVFYIRSAATGEYVSYLNENSPFTDSYGKPVPYEFAEKDISAQAVYYAEREVTPHSFKFEYRTNIVHNGGPYPAWVLMDQSGSSVNGRNPGDGYTLCKYGPDAGNLLVLTAAGVPNITPSRNSIDLGSLVDKKTEKWMTVSGRFLPEDISVSIEGEDAANFSFRTKSDTEGEFKAGSIFVGFTPSELRETPYTATLKLTCGTGEATVALTGIAYPDSDFPKISEDGGEEHWYYIQFKFDMTEQVNLAWTSTEAQGQVTREQITPGSFNDAQLWKIGGNWEEGFYLVNKALGGDLAYNQNPNKEAGTVLEGLTYQGADSGGPDIYYVAEGIGGLFNFVKDKNGYWQLYNRLINSAPTSTTRTVDGYDARYIYARAFAEGYDLVLRQAGENVERTQIIFTEVAARIIPPVKTSYLLKAKATETDEVDITVIGSGLQDDITATFTNNTVFTTSTSALPGEGGTLTVHFAPTSDEEFYADTLTLSSPGASDVKLVFTGTSGKPIFSLEDDVWYTMQFDRRPTKVLQGNGIGADKAITQVAPVDGSYNQQWRFVGTEGSHMIENRAGGWLYFYTAPGNDPCTALTDDESLAGKFSLIVPAGEGREEMWALKDVGNGTGRVLNDFQGNYLCTYTTNGADGGCPIVFAPVEYVPVGRKIIVADKETALLKSTVGVEATATINISSIGIENEISVAVEGAGFDVSPKTLPAEGGELTISFTQTEANKEYSGTITLSSVGAQKNVVIALTGITAPAFSDDLGNEVWYYIQFERSIASTKIVDGEAVNQNAVWQGNGLEQNVTQETLVPGQTNQHWKLVAEGEDNGFKIVNHDGGEIVFLGYDAEKERVDGLGTLIDGGDGDLITFVPESNKWQFWLFEYYDENDSWGCLNDYDGNAADLGIYSKGDPGNYVRFIEIDRAINIENPGIDPNDQEVARKYYTLQGMEVKAPTTTGIYIVKKLYESGKTKAVKEIITVK